MAGKQVSSVTKRAVYVCQGTENQPSPTPSRRLAWRTASHERAVWASWSLVGAIPLAIGLRAGTGRGSAWAARAPGVSTCPHNRELGVLADGNGEVAPTTWTSVSTSPNRSSTQEKRREISSLESTSITTKQGGL